MRHLLLLLGIAAVASAHVVGYRVEPVKAKWSDWTGAGETISQSITCNFDSLSRVEFFAGASDNGGAYRVGVWLDNQEVTWSYGDTVLDHSWIRFERWNDTGVFARGKKYEFRFTRSGSDSAVWHGSARF
ncbi:hypothetical protein JXD38_01040 [candidate division WOR-3 bacterium]|nr:hypothetical protein [candidate division WOR-3 bacterium]